MSLKSKICTVLFFWIATYSYGQMEESKYARSIDGITDQWHQLILPEGIFGKVRPDFADLRIYGITENKDTVEAPYLLRIKNDQLSTAEKASKIINTVKTDKGYYFTFDVASSEAINLIKLSFGEDNFDWEIQLEGSQNQQEWFSIVEEYRILSIKNELTDFQFTELTFPMASFRYFRVLIPSERKPDLKKVTILNQSSTQGEFVLFPIAQTTYLKSTQKKLTEVELSLHNPVPVSRLRINVSDEFDYYRPVTISYLYDSIATQQGWKYNYHTLASGTLNSLEENEFSFESTILQRIKITIQNQDNQALNLGSFEVEGFVHGLLARFTQPAAYFLVYGNDQAISPHYDIQQFADKIPEDPISLAVGNEKQITAKSVDETAPLFQNKAWLWSVMVLIIGLLGWFTLIMMKKK